MLTEIILESLFNMDDDTLNAVLESCTADELDFIDSAVEISNAGRIASNILFGSKSTNNDIVNENKQKERREADNTKEQKMTYIRREDPVAKALTNRGMRNAMHERSRAYRQRYNDYMAAGKYGCADEDMKDLQRDVKLHRNYHSKYLEAKKEAAAAGLKVDAKDYWDRREKIEADAKAEHARRLKEIDNKTADNDKDAIANSNSRSAKVGDFLHQSVTDAAKTTAKATLKKLGKVTKASKNI